SAFSHDHPSPHVHGQYGSVVVVVELRTDGSVAESKRRDAVKPPNGKRSDVRHVLAVAARNRNALRALWETIHGPTSK
ncbi:MAG: DUF4160 domain-containing protein, partial [Acidobacteriaceae bacterium]